MEEPQTLNSFLHSKNHVTRGSTCSLKNCVLIHGQHFLNSLFPFIRRMKYVGWKDVGWGRIQDSYFKWGLGDKTTPFSLHNPLQSWQKDVYIFNFKCLYYYLSLNWLAFQHCAYFPLELLNRLEPYRLYVSLTMLYKF